MGDPMPSASETLFDMVIRGGRVVAGQDVIQADIGVHDGSIVALGRNLGAAQTEIDATGHVVMPGGVDVHAHIEQISAGGLLTADDWESATTAAAMGGTTTVLAFAAQHRGMNLPDVVADYTRRAEAGAIIDYGFHLMIGNPDSATLETDLPALIDAGHRSVKLFMTYDRLAVNDEQALEVLDVARRHGALVCVHAENHGMIAWMARRLLAAGKTAPKFHAEAHPRLSEIEAIRRIIDLARLVGAPLSIFHVSTREGAEIIHTARGEGIEVYGETCPQYLFFTAKDLDKPGMEGAKWMFSPPPRTDDDQAALWQALHTGALQILSSDHAPYAFTAEGKLSHGPDANFKQIANGVPGLGERLALAFDALSKQGNRGLVRFADMTAGQPARIYGLAPAKGTIAIGADADIVLWNPDRRVTLADETSHGKTGYTPYAGMTVQGWPQVVIRRGEIIARDDTLCARPGSGRMATRQKPGF
jgi:dihydropyrimidinase